MPPDARRFVSRGDNSGTNTKEKDIWKLTGVARNAANEPAGSGAANPPWYTKAGLGMADTLRLTQQCPSGGCYTITDRGTLQQLIATARSRRSRSRWSSRTRRRAAARR